AARGNETQQVAAAAMGLLAVIVEGQRGAVLGLLGHAPPAGVEMHAHVAVEQQAGARFDIRAHHLFDFGGSRLRRPPELMFALQRQQRRDHVLAVVAHRATAQPVDVPQRGARLQANGLTIVVLGRALAAGLEYLSLDGQQPRAPLLRIGAPACHARGFEALKPVALGDRANIEAHGAKPLPWRKRQTSTLEAVESGKPQILACPPRPGQPRAMRCVVIGMGLAGAGPNAEGATAPRSGVPLRSEEHTSELQSRENLVCRLLLEKKKT